MRKGDKQRVVSEVERKEIRLRVALGESMDDAAKGIGCSLKTVQRLLRSNGGLPPRPRACSALRLSLAKREEVSRGIQGGDSIRCIAARLKRAPSTISRDVCINGAREAYRACHAERSAICRRRRPKNAKLAFDSRLRREVEKRLAMLWSPQQITASLVSDYPNEPQMRVSHETIYQSLYIQARGALRKELTVHLRTARKRRHSFKRTTIAKQGAIKGMIMISDRPAEASDRAIPGHWEGDHIVGKKGLSVIGTLVERRSRYVVLLRLRNKTAEETRRALMRQLATMPEQLRKTLTWDQGKEMADHAQFTIDTNIDVYFCNPHSPWQRGSNENTNGLLRQYFPRGLDLSTFSQAALNKVARQLNARPRQTLGWMTPAQVFSQTVASTD
jgi:IS30 family transposase